MVRRRIIISFKETPEDIKLYEEIKRHSDQSGYVKDVLRGILKHEKSEQVAATPVASVIKSKISNSEIEDILDL